MHETGHISMSLPQRHDGAVGYRNLRVYGVDYYLSVPKAGSWLSKAATHHRPGYADS